MKDFSISSAILVLILSLGIVFEAPLALNAQDAGGGAGTTTTASDSFRFLTSTEKIPSLTGGIHQNLLLEGLCLLVVVSVVVGGALLVLKACRTLPNRGPVFQTNVNWNPLPPPGYASTNIFEIDPDIRYTTNRTWWPSPAPGHWQTNLIENGYSSIGTPFPPIVASAGVPPPVPANQTVSIGSDNIIRLGFLAKNEVNGTWSKDPVLTIRARVRYDKAFKPTRITGLRAEVRHGNSFSSTPIVMNTSTSAEGIAYMNLLDKLPTELSGSGFHQILPVVYSNPN